MQTTQAYFLETNPAVSSWKKEENAIYLPEYFGIKVRNDFEIKTIKSLSASLYNISAYFCALFIM
jgi:hypothetical protein